MAEKLPAVASQAKLSSLIATFANFRKLCRWWHAFGLENLHSVVIKTITLKLNRDKA